MSFTAIVGLGRKYLFVILALLLILFAITAFHPVHANASPAASPYSPPTWWAKYQRLLRPTVGSSSTTSTLSMGPNVDVRNKDTPQNETSITVNPSNPTMPSGGSRETFRL